MFQIKGILGRLWCRMLLRGTAFGSSYGKLRMLYAMEDPWNMVSPREQHRFKISKAQLVQNSAHYGSILELGCGEGHQSLSLQTLTDRLYGVDVSSKAVHRAEQRCPDATFTVAEMEDINTVFPFVHFDLISACEVLYYARNLSAVLSKLQARTNRLYVSNYAPRSEKMRTNFSGRGWSRLNDISYEDTVWECYLWEANKDE